MRNVGGRNRFFDTTRGQIILHLMDSPHTVSELADKLDLTDNAVRAHLVALERDGVVRQEGERRSGGRPAYVYQVTPEADELFPKAYDRALVHVLAVLGGRMGAGEVEGLLREAGRNSVDAPSSDATWEDRVEAALDLLEDFGGLSESEITEEGKLRIVTKSCPLSSVIQEHPVASHIAKGAVEKVLGVSVKMELQVEERPRCVFEAKVPNAARA